MNNGSSKVIQKRQKSQKEEILERLKTVPIVQVACEQLGLGRATYYRWRKEDEAFASEADESIQYGKHFINDMAESQLISQIKEKNMTAIIFWLKNNHRGYGDRIELTHKTPEEKPELTPEQTEVVERALALGGILNNNFENKENEGINEDYRL